jgi:hypothetical protein
VDLGGSGSIDLGGLEAGAAEIRVSGSGGVTARATRTAQVSLNGSGNVVVAGPPAARWRKAAPGRCAAAPDRH